ncbi:hypothetical protein ABIF90_007237 [Bradyrhizobium japonicum]
MTYGGQADLLRSRLDAIIDMDHALLKLPRTIDWSFLEERFGASTRTSRSAAAADAADGRTYHLKHTYDLFDEVLCERWVENLHVLFQAKRCEASSPHRRCGVMTILS